MMGKTPLTVAGRDHLETDQKVVRLETEERGEELFVILHFEAIQGRAATLCDPIVREAETRLLQR